MNEEQIQYLRSLLQSGLRYRALVEPMQARFGVVGMSYSSILRAIELQCEDLKRGRAKPAISFWRVERVARLRALVLDGFSYHEIALKLSKEWDRPMTRSAVAGVISRYCRDLRCVVKQPGTQTMVRVRPATHAPHNKIEWTEGMDETLRVVLAAGGTLVQAALALYEQHGKHIHPKTIGTHAKAIGLRDNEGPRPWRSRRSVPTAVPDMDDSRLDSIPLDAIPRRGCRWPLHGTGTETVFCPDHASMGAYCLPHAARAYRLAPDPKRESHFWCL